VILVKRDKLIRQKIQQCANLMQGRFGFLVYMLNFQTTASRI